MVSDPSGLLSDRYKFNAIAGRYIDTATGRYESLTSFRRRQQQLTAQLRRSLLAHTRRLQSGRIRVEEWQRVGERSIRQSHREAAVLAAGGEERRNDSLSKMPGRLLFLFSVRKCIYVLNSTFNALWGRQFT